MKQLKFPGDQRGNIAAGDIMGPDAHGLYHEVTAIHYHNITDRTLVETRKHAPNGQRIRYYGGVNNPPPPQHQPITDDTVQAK